jgi:hypothetical protein
MAKQGDWGGGGPGMIKGTVKRTTNVTRNTTSTRAEELPIQGEAPPLKFFSQAQYNREPFDPSFKKVSAKGSNKIRGSR